MNPDIVTLPLQHTVVVRAEVERPKLGLALAGMLPRTFQHALRAGATTSGMPFTRFLGGEGDRLSIEAGVPVAKAVEGSADLVASSLPGGRVAKALHVGPYEQLPAAWATFKAWAQQHGHAPAALWEVYVTDPASQPDPSRWETQLFMAL